MRHRLSALTLAALTTVAAVGAAVPAQAAVAGLQGLTSPNHAGYLVAGGGLTHDVVAQWVQPAASCGSGTTFADVEVVLARGMAVTKMGTSADCRKGIPVYSAWYTGFDVGHRYRVPRRVMPGDVMRVTIDWRHYEADVTIRDVTRHWSAGAGEAGGDAGLPTRVSFALAARSGADGALPLTDVGTVSFHRCSVDGELITGDTATAVTMSRDDTVRALPRAIGAAGDFSVTWQHA